MTARPPFPGLGCRFTITGTRRCTASPTTAPPPFSRNRSAERRPGIRNCFTRRGTSSALKAAPSSTTTPPSTTAKPRLWKGMTFWTPNINIFRDPRWGRGQETYGEDPVSHGRHRRGVCQRHPRRRSQLHAGDGLRQTLRGPQRAGSGAPSLRCRAVGARFV